MAGVRHVVTLTLDENTSPEQIGTIVEEIGALPGTIPQITAYSVGADLGLADGNAQVAVVADFASVEDYEIYRDHPDHQRVIAEHIKPHLTGRSAVQMEI